MPGSHAGTYSGIVAFGDSLTDGGNLATAIGPAFPYPSGRSTNGPVWVEYLAQKLAVPAPTASLLGGTNYAFAFAQSGAGFTSPPELGGASVPNVLTQVGMFQASLGGKEMDSGQLVPIWAEANDFLNNGSTDYALAAEDVAAAIRQVAALGGAHFLVGGLPMLGQLPFATTLNDAQRTGLNLLSLAFNGALEAKLQDLQATIPGIDVHYNDVNGEFQKILADPAAYGLTNTTTAAVDAGVLTGEGYLFWDSVHPTTAVHEIIAEAAFASLAPVPEPSSIVMTALGGVAVAAAAIRARRAA